MESGALLGIALDLLRSDDANLRGRYRERVIDPVRSRVIALISAAADEGAVLAEANPTDLADAVIGGLVYRAVVLGECLSGPELERFIRCIVAGSATSDHC